MNTGLLTWVQEPGRVLAKCGDIGIGAIYPLISRRMRWRVWVTKNMNPVEQTAANEAAAKAAVTERFEEFLKLANLQPRTA